MPDGQDSIDVEKVKQSIKEILAIVDAAEVPEQYKETCFEVLFTKYLERGFGTAQPPIEKAGEREPISAPSGFPIPEEVKVFLSQNVISEPVVPSLFKHENGKFSQNYSITEGGISERQIHVALLTALENALNGGKYEFSIEAVRQRCLQRQCYERTNFTKNFDYNWRLFKGLSKERKIKDLSSKKELELSPDGIKELAKIIKDGVK